MFNQLQGLMSIRVDAVDAMHRALKLVEGAIDQQAALWSYIDDFRYIALVCFATVPIGFALRRVSSKRKVAAH
jgi:MFS transporter, DHA2 family, multidrug resistance protein